MGESIMTRTLRNATVGFIVAAGLTSIGWTVVASPFQPSIAIQRDEHERTEQIGSEVLDWNQLFVDTLIATNTANSASPRLGAIVHTAIFDAFNGIEQRYTPIFVQTSAPGGASRRAAVSAAAHTALVSLFPSQQASLDARYAASLAALSGECEEGHRSAGHLAACTKHIERGIAWGTDVAQAVLAWRAT